MPIKQAVMRIQIWLKREQLCKFENKQFPKPGIASIFLSEKSQMFLRIVPFISSSCQRHPFLFLMFSLLCLSPLWHLWHFSLTFLTPLLLYTHCFFSFTADLRGPDRLVTPRSPSRQLSTPISINPPLQPLRTSCQIVPWSPTSSAISQPQNEVSNYIESCESDFVPWFADQSSIKVFLPRRNPNIILSYCPATTTQGKAQMERMGQELYPESELKRRASVIMEDGSGCPSKSLFQTLKPQETHHLGKVWPFVLLL